MIEGDENEEELGGMKSPVESKFEVFLCGGGSVQKGLPHLVIAKSSLSQTILKMIPEPYIYFSGWEGRMRVFCVLVIFEGRPISPCRGLGNPRRDRCWKLLALSEDMQGPRSRAGRGTNKPHGFLLAPTKTGAGKGRGEAKKSALNKVVEPDRAWSALQ